MVNENLEPCIEKNCHPCVQLSAFWINYLSYVLSTKCKLYNIKIKQKKQKKDNLYISEMSQCIMKHQKDQICSCTAWTKPAYIFHLYCSH